MKKLQSFFLTKVLNKKVYDEYGDYIGKLIDIYVTTEDDYPRAIAYKLKKNGEIYNYEFKNISFYENEGKIIIRVISTRDIILQKYSYLLSKDILNKQVVDKEGKNLVKVNDLRIGEMIGEYKVIALDTGRLLLGKKISIVNSLEKLFNRKPSDFLIMWDNVDSLDMINNGIKLKVSYKSLSDLNLKDLSVIIENKNINYSIFSKK
ncbi:PRC-barrel domain-containing protein [Clostridium niameyense]|uniref:PRC-barrel domain-containing protein n=1 Tax=Clostridium niameyense TaxID=1622073 RepID=UPI00067F71BC|nr:PRC-barrel domain-containing protein [Clostridium niameyense]